MTRFTAWIAPVAFALPCSASASCLTEATDFAQRICGEVKTKGSSTLVAANGDLTAEAKGLIRDYLGSEGGTLQGQTEFTVYENVLREQLGGELINLRQCSIQMAKAAMDQVCVKAPIYKTCSNPAFGVARWQNEETLSGTSGWRMEGYDEGSYCTEFTDSILASRGLFNQPHAADRVSSSEEQHMPSGILSSFFLLLNIIIIVRSHYIGRQSTMKNLIHFAE